jgi:hypothetical protein
MGCLQPYAPPVSNEETNFLVIDGSLTDTSGVTTVRLSRSIYIGTEYIPPMETGAKVSIEADDGTMFALTEDTVGTYIGNKLPVDVSRKYRVNVTTAPGDSYVSDFVEFKKSPPIDSLTWDVSDGYFNVYVSAHDDSGASQYFMWKFAATWSYHTPYYSYIKIENGQIVNRTDDINHCWKTVPSTEVLIGTTRHLSHDVVSKFRIVHEPLRSEKLQYKYSVLAHQSVITQDAYEYWAQLKTNTENLGTIFGNLPSQNVTNFRCTTDPGKIVIGYFTAGSASEKRMTLNADLLPRSPHDTGYEDCGADTVIVDHGTYGGGGMLIVAVFHGPVFAGYLASSAYCVDCRIKGGTNVKPSYWDD